MNALALTLSGSFAWPQAWGWVGAMAIAAGCGAAHAAQPLAPHQRLQGPEPATVPGAAGAWDHALYAGHCAAVQPWLELRRSLHLVHLQLQTQGLQLRVVDCPPAAPLASVAPAHRKAPWVAVGVWVQDSAVASRFVRGFLAEGELLDLAAVPPGVADTRGWAPQAHSQHVAQALDDEEVSPDVHFNRQWLARVMAAQGFAPVSGQWWTFVWQRGGRL